MHELLNSYYSYQLLFSFNTLLDSPHPYIFFNQDRMTMTFLGFLLSANGDLLNPVNKEILEPQLMNATLRGQLKVQGVDFDKNYEDWNR